jgi:hypothetical protein
VACACTSPSLGRGICCHATRLRDLVRSELEAPARVAMAFDAVTEAELTPWYRATLDVDRDRLADIEALAESQPARQVPGPNRQGLVELVA